MHHWPSKPKNARWTIKNLRLNVQEAENGRTWLLLPEGWRHRDAGGTYPLPDKIEDLRVLSNIITSNNKQDSGSQYIRRAIAAFKHAQKAKAPIPLERKVERAVNRVKFMEHELRVSKKKFAQEARQAVDEVRQEAAEASASLRDLFALGRQGIGGQMRAHLDGTEWQGEPIKAKDFRECFRLVSQAVKGLGLPSEQRTEATQAIMEELAESLKDMKDAVALAPGGDEDTEN